jgi:eukaryotic-like serine/threonine-protein kinase
MRKRSRPPYFRFLDTSARAGINRPDPGATALRTCPECQKSFDDEVPRCPQDGRTLGRAVPKDPLVGRTIGSYRVVRQLGKGGMGAVYLAEHPVIGSRVAIKFLHPQFSSDPGIVDRFFNEARAVNVIGHDNILKILDLDVTEDKLHYFVMEFLQGTSLQSFVRPDQPLPLAVAGPILLQICAALQAAHEKRIVHRDLKPDNIHLITHDGRKNFVKVVDFGIAKLALIDRDGQSRTQTGIVMGTPAYMSPEQGTGEAEKIDGRSDIYSLGVMMFQMATGKLPFPGATFAEVLLGHVQRPPPSPRSLEPSIPADYEAVILKTLAKNRDDRFRSMGDLRTAIRVCLDAHGISAQLPAADEREPKAAPAQGRAPRTPAAGLTTPARAARAPLAPLAVTRSSPPAVGGSPRRRSRAVAAVVATLGGVAVLAAAAFFFARMRAPAVERAVPAAAPQPEKLASAAQVAPAEPEAGAAVVLSAVSLPLGATVEATWPGGERTGLAPLSLEVPRNARVHVAFSRADCKPYAMEVVADAARTVTAPLDCQEKADAAAILPSPLAPPAAADGLGERRRKGTGEKRRDKGAAKKTQNDALIDLGDAFR